MNKYILFSATLATSSGLPGATGQSIINFSTLGKRARIAHLLIELIAVRQWRVVLRKRISGRTLPGKSHLKQKRKNSNAPRAARTLPVGAIFSVLPTDKIFPAYCA